MKLVCRRLSIFVLLFFAIVATFMSSNRAHAQGHDPWSAADLMRTALFNAQKALLAGDSETATAHVTTAETIYRESLRQPMSTTQPDATAKLDLIFDTAHKAAQSGDQIRLSTSRGQIWAGVLHGSTAVITSALDRADGETARTWLLLRDFRTPTRFSRPGADATLAINALIEGKRSAVDALAAVRADLLDTYQAQLTETLADLDIAQKRNFQVRQAEVAGLAAGYFDVLSDAYKAQRGTEALTNTRASFAGLIQAISAKDTAAYETARKQIDAALKGFRAAPLSEAEQARRAGQLLRFVGLVPVEYARGIRDGKVVNDIEIQEALTFQSGASAAFADLMISLEKRDVAATNRIATLLDQLETQVRASADPAAVENTANEIAGALNKVLPAEWMTLNSGSDFDVISSVLDQIEPAVKQGQYALAESARLEAYAILDSGIEQKLRGFAPEMAIRVESLFWQGDEKVTGLSVLLTTNASASQVKASLTALRAALSEAEILLGNSKSAPAAVVGNAAVIVFREGLEAVLILASLLASLRAVDSRQFRKPILIGGALAMAASAVTWWVANGLLMSLIRYGEKLEAIVSLIAIAILLLITNWFFHKTYWTGWMANFHAKKSKILGGSFVIGPSLGLILLGFTSIYREGFETVLFLQSLVLDAGIVVVLEGVALGLVGVAIVGGITFALQVRLPYKKMLIATGILIGVVLLTMVGNTVHVMQAVGWMPITPIKGLYFPYWMGQWFGLFATWQGIVLQLVAAVFVIGSYVLAEWMNHRKRAKTSKEHQSPNAESGIKVSGLTR
jgi:high-affinity iron transporter